MFWYARLSFGLLVCHLVCLCVILFVCVSFDLHVCGIAFFRVLVLLGLCVFFLAFSPPISCLTLFPCLSLSLYPSALRQCLFVSVSVYVSVSVFVSVLDASTHIYKRICPLVGRSVRGPYAGQDTPFLPFLQISVSKNVFPHKKIYYLK